MNVARKNQNAFFPSVMDELFKDWSAHNSQTHRTIAPVNIRETENAYAVELMAPGLKKEDFNIELDNDLLTISSEVKTEKTEQEEGKYTRKEFSYISFRRSFTLPETVNAEDINAAYQDGILKITLPKKEEALPKPKRLIDIL